MKAKRSVRALLWLAVLATMAMIFSFSCQNGETSLNTSGGVVSWLIGVLDREFEQRPAQQQQALLDAFTTLVRKGAHFSEYALLGGLLCLLCRSYALSHARLVAWLVATIYAGTDELHQLWVSERSGSIVDVGIDSAGALFGVLVAWALVWAWMRCRRRRNAREARG